MTNAEKKAAEVKAELFPLSKKEFEPIFAVIFIIMIFKLG